MARSGFGKRAQLPKLNLGVKFADKLKINAKLIDLSLEASVGWLARRPPTMGDITNGVL